MAAVTEQPPLVTPTDRTMLYMARRTDLRLVKKPRWPIRDPVSGQPAGMTRGQFVGFHDGVFRCAKEGIVVLQDTLDGGVAEVDAQELIAWMARHRLNGDRHDGFWQVDPTAPPVSEDEMARLMDAAIRLDADTLREMARQERDGWGRDAIINQAEAAVARIEEALAAAAREEQDKKGPGK